MSVETSNTYYNVSTCLWQEKKTQEHGSALATLESIKNKPRTVDFTDKNAQDVAKKIWDGYNSKYCAICRYIDDMLQWVMTTERGKVYHLYQEIMKGGSQCTTDSQALPSKQQSVGDETPSPVDPEVARVNALVQEGSFKEAYDLIGTDKIAPQKKRNLYWHCYNGVIEKFDQVLAQNPEEAVSYLEIAERTTYAIGDSKETAYMFSGNMAKIAHGWISLGNYEKAIDIIASSSTMVQLEDLKFVINSFPPIFYANATFDQAKRMLEKPCQIAKESNCFEYVYKNCFQAVLNRCASVNRDLRVAIGRLIISYSY